MPVLINKSNIGVKILLFTQYLYATYFSLQMNKDLGI